MKDRLERLVLGLASTAIIALAGWLLALYGWQKEVDADRAYLRGELAREQAKGSATWQTGIATLDELNRLRHEMGMPPISWQEHMDRRLEAVTGD